MICAKVVQFIDKTMRKLWSRNDNKMKNIAEVKIQRRIMQGHMLPPLTLVIAMIPLNLLQRKCTEGHKITKSQEKIQPPHVYERH